MRYSILAFSLGLAAMGCTRTNQDTIDFTKLDFAMPSDGGVLPDGFLPQFDFSIDNPVNRPDMARPRVDLAGADLTSVGAVDLAGLDLAGVDMAGGAGCNAFADRPLSWYVKEGVAMNASGPLTVTVPDGVFVSGTVTLPSAPSGGTLTGGSISFRSNTLGGDGTRLVQLGGDNKSFSYQLVLQPGTYTTTFTMSFDLPSSVGVSRLSGSSTTVCGPTTHNHTMPALPALTSKTITTTGLSAFDPLNDAAQPRGAYLIVEDMQHTLFVSGPFGSESAGSATATLPLPAASILPTLWVADASKTTAPEKGGWATNFQLPSAADAASYNFAVPAVHQLTGAVTLGTQLTDTPTPVSITCRDPASMRIQDEDTVAEVLKVAPSYHAYYRKDASCQLAAYYIVKMVNTGTVSANKDAVLVYVPNGGTPITVDADKVNNFTVPSLGTPVVMGGQLRDARDGQLRNYKIRAISSSLSGLSSDHILVVDVRSDANGNFTINALPGTYDLEITSYLE